MRKINQNWNTGHLKGKYDPQWREKWLSKPAHWLKKKYPKRHWHIKKYYGRWYLLRGNVIIAAQHSKLRGVVGAGYFDFRVFLRYCIQLKRLTKMRPKKSNRHKQTFEEQMQFFTAYYYSKEIKQDEQKPDYDDDATFQLLMRGIERNKSRGWDEPDEDDEGSSDGLSRWAGDD